MRCFIMPGTSRTTADIMLKLSSVVSSCHVERFNYMRVTSKAGSVGRRGGVEG